MNKYCMSCERIVHSSRKIGAGTFILAIFTLGWSLLCIPFYRKRCPMCHGTMWGSPVKKCEVINDG